MEERKPKFDARTEAKRLLTADGTAVVLDETDMVTAQEILKEITAIPGVWLQISAWMRAKDFEDPDLNFYELKNAIS